MRLEVIDYLILKYGDSNFEVQAYDSDEDTFVVSSYELNKDFEVEANILTNILSQTIFIKILSSKI